MKDIAVSEVRETFLILLRHYECKITVSQLANMVYFKRYSKSTLKTNSIQATESIGNIRKKDLVHVANLITEADAILTRYGMSERSIKTLLNKLINKRKGRKKNV